jgi:hypothetical protein
MSITFEALKAHKGDSLLLQFGTTAKPLLAVIDGGPGDTFKPALAPRLLEIKRARGLADAEALPIDLLMVSHIDDDHIKGVLELTRELTHAADDDVPPPYNVRSVWHNSFDDLLGTTPDELKKSITAQFGAASTGEIAVDLYPNLTLDAAKVLASVPQGRQLRDDIKKLALPLNLPFKGGLVMLKPGDEPRIRLGPKTAGGIDLRVIGPLKPQLVALQKEHDKFLKKLKKKKDDGESALAAFTDTSAPNLSSIVVEVASDGRKILLTGDARGDFILEGLEACKLLSASKPYVIDVLKAPHHGSDRNMTQEFFERVHATHYVFSGDGEHGNPERETLQMLFDARTKVAGLKAKKFSIWLTYKLDEIDAGREADWAKEFKKGNKTRKWSPAKDGLVAFFKKVKDTLPFELNAGKPVSIELK